MIARVGAPGRPHALLIFAILASLAVAIALLPGGTAVGVALLMLGSVVLILARPDAATPIVIWLIYTNAVVVLQRFHGLPDVAALALPLALCAPFGWYVIVRRQTIIATPTLPLMLVMLIVQLVSAAFSAFAREAAASVATYAVEGIALFMLTVNVIRSRRAVLAAVWSVVCAAAALGALSAFQEATGTYANSYFGFAQVKSPTGGFFTGAQTVLGRVRQPELSGPIGDPNFYAQIMLMALPLGIAVFVASRGLIPKLLAAGFSVLIAIGMVLTFSRGTAVAALLLIPLMLILRFVRWRHLLVVALGGAIVLTIAPEYVQRVATLDVLTNILQPEGISTDVSDVSLRSRATENLAAALVFIDHPILGVGPGQFPEYYREYADRIGLEVQVADRQPHTLYLGIAAEDGALGLLVFLAILAVTLSGLTRAGRAATVNHDSMLATLNSGLILSIVGFMLTGIFLHLAFERYFWLILALANATAATTLATFAPSRKSPRRPSNVLGPAVAAQRIQSPQVGA